MKNNPMKGQFMNELSPETWHKAVCFLVKCAAKKDTGCDYDVKVASYVLKDKDHPVREPDTYRFIK